MPSVPPSILARLDKLIEDGAAIPRSSEGDTYADDAALVPWRVATQAWLTRVVGADDVYTRQFVEVADGWYMSAAINGVGILRQLRIDIEAGYLDRYSTMVAGAVIRDVWEQAAELLAQGFKDAAASVAGVGLELGLKQLADSRGLDVTKIRGIGPLNEALVRESVYSVMRQDQIDVWRGIRNAAAHGEHGTFTESDVRSMIDGVQSFLAEAL